jgi:phospholipase/carboxylesterase
VPEWIVASPPAEFSLFVPLHYEPNYRYPLVVWLHENESDESHLIDAVSALSLRNYVVVGPRGSERCATAGFGWFQSPRAIESSEHSILAAIDSARGQLSIHSERVFIAGQGHGGTMAFRMAFRRPEIFSGVLSINGPLPDGWAPLAQWKRCRRLPIFWTQRRHDTSFDEPLLSAQLRLLYCAGFDVALRQYPRERAELAAVLPDANRWLMSLIGSSIVA